MADFKFYLSRQGPKGETGAKGEKGDNGNTPIFSDGINTPTVYTMQIDMGDGNVFETQNLKYPMRDDGGNYLRYDRTDSTVTLSAPNVADLQRTSGEVTLASVSDVENEDAQDTDAVSMELRNADQLALDNEIDRIDGDIDTVDDKVDREIQDRQDADTQLTNKINTDVGNEATARSNADTALNGRIDGLDSSKANKSEVYPKTQTDSLLNNKSNVGHTHNYNEITNKPTIPTVGDGTITITQGGVTKGTFTTNQSGNSTIALDAGGGGGSTYTAGDGINISNDIISVKVDESTIDFDTNGKLKVIGSVAPSNMVTTNTDQNITGPKFFRSGGTGDNYLSTVFYGTNGNEFPVIYAFTDHHHIANIWFTDNANNDGSCIKLLANNAEIIAYNQNTDIEYPMIHTGNIDTNTISYNQTNKNIEVTGGKLNTIIKTSLCETNKNASITSNILTVPQEYYDGTDNPTSFGYVQVPATSYLYFRGVMNRLNSTGDDYGICGFGNTITTANASDSLFIDRYSGGRLTPNNYADITYLSGMSDSGNLYFDLIYDNGSTSFIIYTDDTFTTTSATYTCSSTPTTYTYIILGCRSTLINSSNCTFDLSKSFYKTSSNGNFIPLYNESTGTVLVKGLDARYLGIDSNNNLTLDIQAIKDAIDNL